MHEHDWYFTLRPGRWTAACACGLAVAVERRDAIRQAWTWTLHGERAPARAMAEGVRSLTRSLSPYLAVALYGRDN